MKKLLFLIFIFVSLCTHAQQRVEICNENNTIFTYSTSILDGTYTWTLNDNDIGANEHFIVIDWRVYGAGTYHIDVNFTNDYGCSAEPITYDIIVTECHDFEVWIPNAFSPNDDVTNENFIISGYGFDPNSFSMEIYDRWGKKLFRTTDINEPWNGRVKSTNEFYPIGVYAYLINLTDDFGRKHQYVGTVTIVE